MTVVKGSVTRRAPKVHLVESPAAALTVKTVARFSGQRPVDTQAGGDWSGQWRVDKRRFPTFSAPSLSTSLFVTSSPRHFNRSAANPQHLTFQGMLWGIFQNSGGFLKIEIRIMVMPQF